jgi:PPOX class probable F420-dependent enzyme
MTSTGHLSFGWATLLKTRKRDGSWVATPVNLAVDGDRAYFAAPANTGKVKRLRNFDEVEITPCSPRGTPKGPTLTARARRLEGAEAAAANRVLVRKHRFVHGLVVPLELKLRRTSNVLYELTGFRPVVGRSKTAASASTTSGSNCVPAQRRSSARASSIEQAWR